MKKSLKLNGPLLFALLLAPIFVSSIPSAFAQTAVVGQWSSDSPWPTVGVHLAVLPDGRVMTWGEDTPAPGTTAFNSYVVTIPSGSRDTSNVQNFVLNDDIFCAGETFLPDGRLFVSGGGDQPAPTNGTGRATTDIFDPSSNTWSSGPTMSGRRWYPTATALPSGDILNLLGSIDMNFTPNETPDVTTNGATGIRSLTSVSSANLFYNYPRAFVAPNGKVFLAGMEQTTSYLDTSGTGAYSTVASSNFGSRVYGTAVMYDVGKVLIAGGATTGSTATPTNTAEAIDLTAATPSWRNIGPMAFARRYLNGTLMADGKVLISGGLSSSPPEDCTAPILPAEIWDPATGAFTTVASMPHYRGYHSAAVLLPDGRILSTGTTANGSVCADQKDADFYSPPYLFNGPRPTITSTPSSVSYGQLFTVNTFREPLAS
jgi:Kelch motif